MNDLRYPIGKFTKPEVITEALLNQFISDIETFPLRIKNAVNDLSDEQLDTPYRPEGWTIRQVVNHCADSHMNSLMRLKLALTEETPTIKPYFEERWAELSDSKSMPVEPALKMLEGIHKRWVVLLKSLTEKDWERKFIHPQSGREFTIAVNTALYAWHCNHHLAHITTLKKSKDWN